MVDYAERGRATEKRHSAAKHRQRGVGKRDETLEAGRRVERSHSEAKHKARFRLPERERTAMDDDEYADWRKKYFRVARPDLDPQSTTSKVLEWFGQDDDPYARDARSYDYRDEAWRESAKSGNPDLSWFLPEAEPLDDQAVDARYPVDTLSEEDAQALGTRLIERFKRDHDGREPTEDEWNEIVQRNFDPRTRAEKNAGATLNFLDFPLFSAADEATAGAMSLLPGRGTYDEELARARAIQQRYATWEPAFSPRNVTSTAGSIAAGFAAPLGATYDAANASVRAARGALRLAPEATSTLGKAVSAVASGAPAGALDFAAMDFGAGEGGFENRVKSIDPNSVISGAIGGGLVFPAFGALGSGIASGGKKTVSGAGKIAKRLMTRGSAKPRYEPTDIPPSARPRKRSVLPDKLPGVDATRTRLAAGDGSVRGDVKRAFARHTPPRKSEWSGVPGYGLAAAATGAGATAAIANDIAKRKRRKRYDGS